MSDDSKRDAAEATPATSEAAPPDLEAKVERASELRDSDAHEDAAQEHNEAERTGSIAGTLLTWLLIFLAGAGVAIWGLPKIAPHLPASVARYVAPAGMTPDADYQQALDQRFAGLEARIAAAADRAGADEADRRAALDALADTTEDALRAARAADEKATEALSALGDPRESAAPVDQEARDAVSALDAKLSALSSALKSAGDGQSDSALAARVAEVEATLAALRDEMRSGGGGGDPSLAGRLSALSARTDEMSRRLAASPERVDALATRVDELAAKIDREAEARSDMADSLDQARRSARAGAAFAELERAAASGGGFSRSLDELRGLGVEAPEAVSGVAAAGAPSYDSLIASFPTAARRALDAASSAAAEGESGVSGVFARLEARVTGLPREAQEGGSPAAVLSRARAAINARNAAGALAEIEALPQPARAAMADWTAGAQSRAALDSGLSDWRADIRAKL